MKIVKSLKIETGKPHRNHRSSKNQKQLSLKDRLREKLILEDKEENRLLKKLFKELKQIK